jgi:hypothetical protein
MQAFMDTSLNSKVLIDRLFSLLDDWRNLPAYQLERRADIFFAIYLDKIIKSKFGYTIDFVVPEFPVRVGDISEKLPDLNKSFKIDYVAVCEQMKKVYFIELKTDQTSRRDKQDWYLEKAKEINVTKLMDGIIKIYGATAQKTKYNNLISLLSKIGWLLMDTGVCTNTSKDYEICVVYIQPVNGDNADNIISFSDIASYLADQQDDLTKRFVQSLNSWTANPNVATKPAYNRGIAASGA